MKKLLDNKPTEKQLSFIANIEDLVGIPFDYKNVTKKNASLYISNNIDKYSSKRKLENELEAIENEFKFDRDEY